MQLQRSHLKKYRPAFVLAMVLAVCLATDAGISGAQESTDVLVDPDEIQSVMGEQEATPPVPGDQPSGIDLLSLIARGGNFMIPIGLMSLLVVTLAVERALTLRPGKVLPRRFARRLRELMARTDRFDPKAAYQICDKHRSPAATVIAAMLLRTGQPLGEIERTASEAAQREADRCAAPVRWLNLAAAATPLMGLLGTVWGMIVAFHESTTLTPDRSRSEQLSEGIYTALVTTLAGLVVAIPAAIIAQYLENRLGKLFHRVEELAFRLAPGVDRFHGKMRLDPETGLRPLASGNVPPSANASEDSSAASVAASTATRSPTVPPQSAAVDEVG